jgi:hypothetical protein
MDDRWYVDIDRDDRGRHVYRVVAGVGGDIIARCGGGVDGERRAKMIAALPALAGAAEKLLGALPADLSLLRAAGLDTVPINMARIHAMAALNEAGLL